MRKIIYLYNNLLFKKYIIKNIVAMNNIIHDYLNKLRLISKLKEGQSLYVKDTVNIYEFNYINWLWRKFYNDNKNEVVRYLQELYKSIDQSIEILINEINTHNKETFKKKSDITIAIILAEKIKSSINGIENLSKTYIHFPQTVAMLEGIIQDYAISSYKQLMEIIPEELKTKNLSGNVIYNDIILYQEIMTEDLQSETYEVRHTK
jgi:hypothetical protein